MSTTQGKLKLPARPTKKTSTPVKKLTQALKTDASINPSSPKGGGKPPTSTATTTPPPKNALAPKGAPKSSGGISPKSKAVVGAGGPSKKSTVAGNTAKGKDKAGGVDAAKAADVAATTEVPTPKPTILKEPDITGTMKVRYNHYKHDLTLTHQPGPMGSSSIDSKEIIEGK